MTKTLIRIAGWAQLLCGIVLAVSITWTYSVYRSSLTGFTEPVAASILSASNLITMMAETLKARQTLIDNATNTMRASRKLVSELRGSAENQGRMLPHYAENLKYASSLASNMADQIEGIGDALKFSVPSDIKMDGLKPKLVMTKPLEHQANTLKSHAGNIKSLSASLTSLSVSMNGDGQRVNAALIATCDQTLKLLDDFVVTATTLKKQDFPAAIAELETASRNLRAAKVGVSRAEDFSLALLVVGLIFSVWCSLSGIWLLLLCRQKSLFDNSALSGAENLASRGA